MGSRAIQLWNKLTNGEKYLIILDDIWEKLDVMAIGIPITDVNKKCKVLLTSRDKDLLLIKMKVDSFAIEELPEAETWDLFKKKVGNSFESDPEMDFIAHALCKRCQGLPVAINAIGAALEGKLVHVWKDALAKMERYELMDIEGIDPSVWAYLRLSYDFLSENAKSCFLLCCLFRDDAEIQIGDLTRHCLARRLLFRNPRTLEEVRNSVSTVIDVLKSASLLLAGSDNNFVRIHDIIREVGISIAREEKAFYVELGALHWPENPIDRPPYSAISLISGRIEALPTKLTCPKLHTLMFENSKLLDLEVPDEFFSEMTQLSVLVLTGMRMQQLPSSFGKLAKLRMLFLIECHLADISILGDLNNELEVLRLRGSIIKALSPISGQLTSLRVLDLEKCKLKYLFSPTTARGLVHLEQLQVSSCDIMERIVGFEGDGNEHVGEVKFAKLKQLKLENLPNLISFYAKKEKTRTTMGSSTTNAQPLFNETVIFPLLEVLSLRNLDNITDIWDKKSAAVVEDQGSFCQLMEMNVDGCAQLTHLFPSKMHALLKNLKDLNVSGCGTMKRIVEFEGEIDEDGLKNELCFSKLSTLKLLYLPNLVSFCNELRTAGTSNGNATILAQPLFNEKVAFPALEVLFIYNVPNITEIWDKKPLPESEKETQSFWRLRDIHIHKCNQLVYVLPCYMLPQLQINLQRLWIISCKEVEVIVSKELKEKEATENEIIVFHQLKDVSFWRLPKLKSFYTGTELLSDKLQHLEELSISDCKKLEVIVSKELKEKEVIHNDIVFPQLKTVQLWWLPNLKRICTETQLFFSDEHAFPALEGIGLYDKDLEFLLDGTSTKEECGTSGKENDHNGEED
ncbi:hypothetical protein Vadar_019276 [Vaccinium darrowii]|uniref:Uncharacterized protein n=1 Tax=Vaccinium darrowii TaxID=229202 RepID=A0ACB7YMV0_9ERIC|nr:hypothetical protein Vadar_019276 [Vaccinium darrowii]